MKQFNDWLALKINDLLSTMWVVYAAIILAIIGFPFGHASVRDYIQWFSQTFIQLVMLFVLMVVARIGQDKIEQQHKETRTHISKTIKGK